jgi:hypothetical protein
MNQFDSVVDGSLLSKFLNALCNRPLIHDFNLPAAKRKSGRKPTGQRRRRPDKKGDYTERIEGRQT